MGFHLAERFGKEGFHVLLTARSGASLAEMQERLREESIEADSIAMDVSDEAPIRQAYQGILQRPGTPDVIICNVGITSVISHRNLHS